MSEQTRWIVVDDRDSRIAYSGMWSSTTGSSHNSIGSFGETYLNTLRNSTAAASSATFSFTGNAARIMGTMTGKTNPAWECLLDGNVVAKETPEPYPHNNQAFCKFYVMDAGLHTVGINLLSTDRPLLIDQIQYKPTEQVDNATTYLTRLDPNLQYDDSWGNLGDFARLTHTNGGTVTLPFVGTQLTWYGAYANELPHDDANGTYTIDGGSPVPFTIKGGGNGSAWNRIIFETAALERREHTLVVKYLGSGSVTPLVVSQIFIQDGTTKLMAGSPVTLPDPSSSDIPSRDFGSTGGSTDAKKFPPGAIAGIVVGVVALLLGVLFVLYRRRRLNRDKLLPRSQAETIEPFPTFPVAAPLTLTTSTSGQTSSTSQDQGILYQKSQDRYLMSPSQSQMGHQYERNSSTSGSTTSFPARILRKGEEANPSLVTSSPSSRPDSDSTGPVFTHQDSGIRIPGPEPITEYPPVYTP